MFIGVFEEFHVSLLHFIPGHGHRGLACCRNISVLIQLLHKAEKLGFQISFLFVLKSLKCHVKKILRQSCFKNASYTKQAYLQGSCMISHTLNFIFHVQKLVSQA